MPTSPIARVTAPPAASTIAVPSAAIGGTLSARAWHPAPLVVAANEEGDEDDGEEHRVHPKDVLREC